MIFSSSDIVLEIMSSNVNRVSKEEINLEITPSLLAFSLQLILKIPIKHYRRSSRLDFTFITFLKPKTLRNFFPPLSKNNFESCKKSETSKSNICHNPCNQYYIKKLFLLYFLFLLYKYCSWFWHSLLYEDANFAHIPFATAIRTHRL